MNVRLNCALSALAVLGFSVIAIAQPVGTSFTYQGRLKESGLPANAPVDLQFNLYDALTGGAQVGSTICRDNVPVVDGLFTCSLDFGPVFTGMERYLEIGVRAAGGVGDCGTGSYTPLSARQKVDGVPYAQWSNLGPGGSGGDGCCDPRIDVATLPGSATAKYLISAPGSYYLRGNINGESGKNGIEINASGVTFDLNGFTLIGAAGTLNGIKIGQSTRDIAVANGTIQAWGGSGVYSNLEGDFSTFPFNIRLTNIRCSSNGDFGIRSSFYSVIMSCLAYSNGGIGIFAAFGTITDCIADNNGETGISIDAGAISNCAAMRNGADGISGYESVILNCNAYNNVVAGFVATYSSVTSCNADSNDSIGFDIHSSAVVNCNASFNLDYGIYANFDCNIVGNRCGQSPANGHVGGALYVAFDGNRVEGNLFDSTDHNVEVSGSHNVIIRNTCRASTAFATCWTIAANNVYGPIVDRRAPGSPSVNGFSAAGSLGTTDPNANFSY